MEVADRIRAQGAALTSAERRVAEAILEAPQAVGFGTVADLAQAAGVGAASVVRLATKLGFEGYTDLQACVQRDLMSQLRPAAERIQESATIGHRSDQIAIELTNVQATLDNADADSLAQVTERLADLHRPVAVLSGEASAGVARQFAHHLGQLRPNVQMLRGSEVIVRRDIALLPAAATAVVIDLRRYERWVLDAHAQLSERGIWSAGLTDGMLSPIAGRSAVTFLLSAGSVSPFDSHVGTLALLNLFVANVSTALRSSAAERLAAVEAAWSEHQALTDPK